MNRWMKWALLAAMLAAIAALVPSPALAYEWTLYGLRVAVGAAAALLLLMALRRREIAEIAGKGHAASVALLGRVDPLDLALWVIPAALVGARLSYCLIRFSFYFVEMGPLSVLRIWEGGFLLYGALLGALAAAALLSRRQGASVAATLDELAAPGLLAVAVARLAEPVTGEGVGAWIENEALMRFPIAYMNEYEEWQLAVFLFEAVAALILLIPVLRERVGKGERIMTALLLFASCQVVLESLRMDSCLKIGFVRVSQVASGVAILIVALIRARRFGRPCMIRRAGLIALCVAAVGGIEWALDKTPLNNIALYMAMIAVCALMVLCGARFKTE